MTEAVKIEDVQSQRARALVDKLWGDKTEGGAYARKTAKEMFPDVVIPEDQTDIAVAPLKAEIATMGTKLTEALDKLAKRDQADADMQMENALAVKVGAARKTFNLTDAGFTKMLDRMKETGNVSDPEAAAAWVHTQTPAPKASDTPSWLPQSANFYGSQEKDDAFEKLHTNPQKYMDDQLKLFVQNPDQYVAETFGNA